MPWPVHQGLACKSQAARMERHPPKKKSEETLVATRVLWENMYRKDMKNSSQDGCHHWAFAAVNESGTALVPGHGLERGQSPGPGRSPWRVGSVLSWCCPRPLLVWLTVKNKNIPENIKKKRGSPPPGNMRLWPRGLGLDQIFQINFEVAKHGLALENSWNFMGNYICVSISWHFSFNYLHNLVN